MEIFDSGFDYRIAYRVLFNNSSDEIKLIAIKVLTDSNPAVDDSTWIEVYAAEKQRIGKTQAGHYTKITRSSNEH